MSCPGLHCAGCGGGAAVPVVAIAAFCGVAWIAEHLVEVIAIGAGSGILAVAAVVALMRWTERREARFASSRPLLTARVVPEVSPSVAGQIAQHAERPALGYRDIHIHLHGEPTAEQAAVIRQAIGGR